VLAMVRFAAVVAAQLGKRGVSHPGLPVTPRTANDLQRIGSGSLPPERRGRLIETAPCQK
jgi:hypothetical protein